MLRGETIGLRARQDEDVPVLDSGLYDDVATRVLADSRPWRPVPPGSAASPYAVGGPSDDAACFSVVRLADGQLAGEALLWDIDLHNRGAHLGLALLPEFRGRGMGTDVVRVLCRYGFAIRGLHWLQLETLVDNAPMLRAAAGAGFVREGTRRSAAWADGRFRDEAILGLLAAEWLAREA
jgi:RimJ/RimL family protein N-acetyltransferase